MPRDNFRWEGHDQYLTKVADISAASKTVLFYRERMSHQGIGKNTWIERLGARMVNQEFLGEISELGRLTELKLEGVSAHDLGPIHRLRELRLLKLQNVSSIKNFEVVLQLPKLEALYFENARHLHTADFLVGLQHIRRLGIEGGMYKHQRLESLAPLARLEGLEELYLASVTLRDKTLSYLAHLPRLAVLHCARFAPKSEFDNLRNLMPNLECHWCDNFQITS